LVLRLSGAADIVAIDMPGFGKTSRVGPGPDSLSLGRLAECAISVADAVGWRKPFFLVGHSHGGGVAQAAAARYPNRIAGLVLIGTLGAPMHASYRLLSLPGAAALARVAGRAFRSERLRPVTRAILRRAMLDIFWPERVSEQRIERELALLASRPEILENMVHVTRGRPCAQLLDSAANIRCPTLFLHGREDALLPVKCARSIHARILKAGGCSQLQLIPEAGHMLIDYQARELADIIRFELSSGKLGNS
jgi:pimeloyl-ACP methyl ester carboxylesterase